MGKPLSFMPTWIVMEEFDWAKKDYPFTPRKYFAEAWSLLRTQSKTLFSYSLIITAIYKIIEMLPNEYIKALLLFFLLSLFNAGFYVFLTKYSRKETASLSNCFEGFHTRYFLPVLLANLMGGIAVGLGFFLLIVPGIFMWVCTFFITNIVVDRNPGVLNSVKASFFLVRQHWIGFFLLFIFLLAMECLSYFTRNYGFIVVLPVSACLVFSTYKNIAIEQGRWSSGISLIEDSV